MALIRIGQPGNIDFELVGDNNQFGFRNINKLFNSVKLELTPPDGAATQEFDHQANPLVITYTPDMPSAGVSRILVTIPDALMDAIQDYPKQLEYLVRVRTDADPTRYQNLVTGFVKSKRRRF
jgi:hypothetical protein